MRRTIAIAIISAAAVSVAGVVTAQSTSTVCSNASSPCISYKNTSSGSAVNFQGTSGFGSRGSSQSGIGLQGKTSSGSLLHPGIDGESTNNNGTDVAGGFGLTGLSGTGPAFGAFGNGGTVGAFGEVTTLASSSQPYATGVYGADPSDLAQGTQDNNVGVYGFSLNNGTGVLAEAETSAPSVTTSLPVGIHAAGPFAVYTLADGVSLLAISSKTSHLVDILDGEFLFAIGDSTTATGPGYQYAELDSAGNEYLTGTFTSTGKSTQFRTRGTSGITKLTYQAHTTRPLLEDNGEAQLANGVANVKLDASLADVVDRRSNYLVFVTPEGATSGLYVAAKTPEGFTVREQEGGRSTLAFTYRIVAKPVGDDRERLALAPPGPRFVRAPSTTRRAGRREISPVQAFARHLGPVAYAKALREFERQQKQK